MFNNLIFNNGIGSNRKLLAWWRLEKDLNDYSGNGYTLSVATGSVPFATTAGKQCIGPFTGGDLTLPSSLMTALAVFDTRNITVEVEIYTDPTLAASQEILDLRGVASNPALIFDIRNVGNSQSTYINPPGTVSTNATAVPTNAWTNLSYSNNAVTDRMYLNSAPVHHGLLAPDFSTIVLSKIGNDANGSALYPFRGYMRNLKLWAETKIPPFPTIIT